MAHQSDNKLKFTVCMAVYKNDEAEDFMTAVNSIYTPQTVKPDEIIIVVDGPVPESIEEAICILKQKIPIINIIRFQKNCGHAAARQAGLEASRNKWIAIMDADDISVPERFEKQVKIILEHPGISVTGGQIKEFIGSVENSVGERVVPLTDTEIKRYLTTRCPMNFMTVMYKKDDILTAGGFIDWYCNEDYYLWIRMSGRGFSFANSPDTLVNVRVGKGMYERRGGWKYFKSEAKLQLYMLGNKIISPARFIINVTGRFAIQVAIPNCLRGFIYQKLFRK